jgi:hypothetical protein
VKFGKFWKVIFSNIVESEEENEDAGIQVDYSLNSMTYSGIKIHMVEGDGVEEDGGEEKIVYGI